MNKEKTHQVTARLPIRIRFTFSMIAFLIAVNPAFVQAKDTQTQKSTATKNTKKRVKNDTSKITKEAQESIKVELSAADTQKAVEETASPTTDLPETEQHTSSTAEDSSNDTDNSVKTDRGYKISVGPLLGVRTMKMQGNRNTYEHNAPFYMGGMLDGELRLHRFSRFGGELWFQADAGYGTTIGGFGHTDLANRSTAIAFLSGQFLMRRSFGDDWDLQFGLGMQALSLTVEPNKTYTGHRYIGPQIGMSARRWFDNHKLSLGTELYALPVLWVNQSSQTDDAQSFGLRASAELGWSPGEGSWALRLRYRFQRFRSQFPLASEGSRGAISEDNQHLLMLMFSY